jgi:hypothetical protein
MLTFISSQVTDPGIVPSMLMLTFISSQVTDPGIVPSMLMLTFMLPDYCSPNPFWIEKEGWSIYLEDNLLVFYYHSTSEVRSNERSLV